MMEFKIEFETSAGDSSAAHTFVLCENTVAEQWLKAVAQQTTHLMTSGKPTEARLTRQWQVLRYFVTQANEDHLLDEWLHIPTEMPSESQDLLNSLRLRAQAYEMYASANDQTSRTRTALIRVIGVIDALEASRANLSYIRFLHDNIDVPDFAKTNTASAGTITLVQPGPCRSMSDALAVNDTTLISKRLIKPWANSSNVSQLNISNFESKLSDELAEYQSVFSVPVAEIKDNTVDLNSLSMFKIKKILL